MLQFTDELNLKILTFYTENLELMNPIADLQNHNALSIIFRLFEAQPYFRQLWDNSPLFQEITLTLEFDQVVLSYIRRMIHSSDSAPEVPLEICCQIDKNLRVTKQELDGSLDLIYQESIGKSTIFEDGLVSTQYLEEKAKDAIG